MKIIFTLVFSFLVCFLLFNCKKNQNLAAKLPTKDEEIIAVFKSKFEGEILNSKIITPFDSINKYIGWDSGKVTELSTNKSVLVPIRFGNNWKIKCTQNELASVTVSANSNCKLLLYFDGLGEFHSEVLSFFPDIVHSAVNGFQSFILYKRDWHGSVVNQMQTLNGEILKMEPVKELQVSTNVVSQPYIQIPTDPAASGSFQTCTVIDWYNCNDPFNCTYSFTQNLGCTNYTFYGGGSSGFTSTNNLDINYGKLVTGIPTPHGPYSQGTYAQICPPGGTGSYNFTAIGDARYMRFTNIGLSLVWGPISSGNIYTYYWQSPCFQISNYSAPTAAQATNAINQAWNYAIQQTLSKVQVDNNIGDWAIKGNMESFIRQYLRTNYPGSTFNASGCSGNIARNTPTYCSSVN